MRSNKYIAPLLGGLSALVEWLRTTHTPYALVGGLAASFYGRPRMTQDLDALVCLDDDELEDFLSRGEQWGYRPRISDCVAFARESNVLLVQHYPTSLDADLICAGLDFEHDVVDRASAVHIAGIAVQLPTPEDLIVMKAVAQRPRDIADIEGILDSRRELDWQYIVSRTRAFGEALDSSEITRTIERLCKRHAGEEESGDSR